MTFEEIKKGDLLVCGLNNWNLYTRGSILKIDKIDYYFVRVIFLLSQNPRYKSGDIDYLYDLDGYHLYVARIKPKYLNYEL